MALLILAGLGTAGFVGGAVTARDSGEDEPFVPEGKAKQTVKKSMWGATNYNGIPLFPKYRDLGVGLHSDAIRWDYVAKRRPKNPTDPNDPAYVWPEYLTDAIAESDKYGMEVNVMVLGTPKWANGGKDWFWTPKNPKDYGDFVAALSKRYPSVDHFMIWGEPNRTPNYQPSNAVPEGQETAPLGKAQQIGPRNYALLLDAAYEGVKGVDPKDNVIGGNTYTSAGVDDINPYQWIQNLKLPDGSRPRLDMWGHNPFGFAKPNLDDEPSRKGVVAFADLRRLTEELDVNFDGPPLKLFLAEWGVPFGFKDLDIGYERNEEDADDWIRTGFEIARDWDRIYTLGWIHPIDTDRSSMGLLRLPDPEGPPVTELEEKPTYDSYKGS